MTTTSAEGAASSRRSEEKTRHWVALDRSSGKIVKLRLNTVRLAFAGTVQSSQRRENLDIDVSGCMQRVACDAPTNGGTRLVVQQKIDKRGRIDHSLSHDA